MWLWRLLLQTELPLGDIKAFTIQFQPNHAEAIRAQIILFNRRSEGEVSLIYLEAFVTRENSPPNEDIAKSAIRVGELRVWKFWERVAGRCQSSLLQHWCNLWSYF